MCVVQVGCGRKLQQNKIKWNKIIKRNKKGSNKIDMFKCKTIGMLAICYTVMGAF